jgi:hypothetical protein
MIYRFQDIAVRCFAVLNGGEDHVVDAHGRYLERL